jgi:hypothetical protein
MGEEQIKRFVRDLHGQSPKIIKRGDISREALNPAVRHFSAARILPAITFRFYIQIARILFKPSNNSDFAGNMLLQKFIQSFLNCDSWHKTRKALRS